MNELRLVNNPPSRGGQRAVFLSYLRRPASAERLCAALWGIAVWFDRSELRGGDVRDAAIRQQIRACTLFVPNSVNTRARAEGHFRLEWKLAVDRSDLLAGDKASRAGGHRRHPRQRCAGTRKKSARCNGRDCPAGRRRAPSSSEYPDCCIG
ncbi:MAG TPA: toll/interleukin-1 receptor domain-containing protein [Steroidobacteraceae bacterium]|jgi:hypothetical protein|nr:toll/interleukin-1 receptor domain-containing protein [Steroidobacteraceae bacterium]